MLVFDEVDAGIGGLTAGKIGVKMATLAAYHQVITVTHLPQIAARATSQFHISKSEKKQRRVTGIERLDPAGRREEIARMLGGTSESALRHADELLREAQVENGAAAKQAARKTRQPRKPADTLPGM